MKISRSIGIYVVASGAACFLYNSHWLLSFLLGPMEHLSLFLHAINNADQYLDGQSRFGKSEFIAAAMFFAVWVLGGFSVSFAFGGKSNFASITTLLLFWVCIGGANIYLFAVRSV